MTSSTLTTISNYFRPTRGEALVRLRINVLCLLSLSIATYLLPLPSIPSSVVVMMSSGYEESGEGSASLGWWWWSVCLFEVVVTALCGYNIVEGLYAIKYPREPAPPAHLSPLKKKQGLVMSPSPAKRSGIISPNSTPSKIFASASKSLSFSSPGTLGQSQSTPGKYAPTPLSTPSRIVRYNMPPQPSSAASAGTNASSTSTMPPTPSPVVSAYRGKVGSVGVVGRPIDGLYLSQMSAREEDEEED